MQTISKGRLTLLRKLNRKKYREQEQLFLVEGVRAVEQVIANQKVEVEELFFDGSQHLWRQDLWRELGDSFPAALLDAGHFAEISDTDSPQGVLALCKIPPESPPEELKEASGLIVASDGIQDPGNMGTIMRTAVWFGATGIISGKGTVDLFHPKVVRSTAGATGMLQYCNGELSKQLPVFEKAGWQVFLLHGGSGAVDIRKAASADKSILVVGNEAHGVDEHLFQASRKAVSIPPATGHPSVESLNAAIATGIALYALT